MIACAPAGTGMRMGVTQAVRLAVFVAATSIWRTPLTMTSKATYRMLSLALPVRFTVIPSSGPGRKFAPRGRVEG